MADLRPPLAPPQAVFGVSATVTPVGGSAISTTVIWAVRDVSLGAVGSTGSAPAAVTELRDTVSIPRVDVPTLRPNSRMIAPRQAGQAAQTWVLDRVEDHDSDFWIALARPVGVA